MKSRQGTRDRDTRKSAVSFAADVDVQPISSTKSIERLFSKSASGVLSESESLDLSKIGYGIDDKDVQFASEQKPGSPYFTDMANFLNRPIDVDPIGTSIGKLPSGKMIELDAEQTAILNDMGVFQFDVIGETDDDDELNEYEEGDEYSDFHVSESDQVRNCFLTELMDRLMSRWLLLKN